MRHRITVLFSLFALVTVVTTGTLAAGPAPADHPRDRVASRSLAQASPVDLPPGVVGNLTIIIQDGERGDDFEYRVLRGENDGYIIWNNVSRTAHDLEITIEGVATTKIQLESNESFHMLLHQPGTVHWKCTTHGEGGTL